MNSTSRGHPEEEGDSNSFTNHCIVARLSDFSDLTLEFLPKASTFRNPNATVYFDFVDGGDKYSAQLDRIMSLRGMVIPNRDDGNVWVMLDPYNL